MNKAQLSVSRYRAMILRQYPKRHVLISRVSQLHLYCIAQAPAHSFAPPRRQHIEGFHFGPLTVLVLIAATAKRDPADEHVAGVRKQHADAPISKRLLPSSGAPCDGQVV